MPADDRHRESLDSAPAPGEVLARIHGRLMELNRCADDLQATIGAIVGRLPTPLASDEQVRLQAADALSQGLERLVQLVGALEATAPRDWAVGAGLGAGNDLAQAMARLDGAGDAAPGKAIGDRGECELF